MKKINKILPILLTTIPAVSLIPTVSSCNKNGQNDETIETWKAAWHKITDFNSERNLKAVCQAHANIKNETEELLPPIVKPVFTYQSNSTISVFHNDDDDSYEEGKNNKYNFVQDGIYWYLYDDGTTPLKAYPILNRTADSNYFDKYLTIFSAFIEMYNAFEYDESSKTATWTLLNIEDYFSLDLKLFVSFDSKLIKQLKLAADVTLKDTTLLGTVKGEIALTVDLDYSKQSITRPSCDFNRYHDTFTYDDTNYKCWISDAHSIDSYTNYVYTNKNVTNDDRWNGVNKIMYNDGANYTVINNVNIIVNDKELVMGTDYIVNHEYDFIKLSTPLKRGDVISVCIRFGNSVSNDKHFCFAKTYI